jgi:hypothetical protein
MGWTGTWTTAADLQGHKPENILSQLRAALAERASVVASPPALPCWLMGDWDSGVTYTRNDAVDRDMVDQGTWDSIVSYAKYDMVEYEDDQGAWSISTAYTKWQKVAVNVGGIDQYYIASRAGTGKSPLTQSTYWWPIDLAPKRRFYALQASTNKSPHTQTAYWTQRTEKYLTFIAANIAANLNKDPLTEPSYWTLRSTEVVPRVGSLVGAAWFTAFQSAATNLIPQYANHQTSGGDYSGLTAIPMWSEADILTAISASARIAAPGGGKLTAAWAYQQFLMLNKLRWYSYRPLITDTYRRVGNSVDLWNAASWINDTLLSGSAGVASWCSSYATYKYANSVLKYYLTLNGSLSASGVLYLKPYGIGSYYCDLGWTEAVFNAADMIAEQSSVLTSAEIGNRAIAPSSPNPNGYFVQPIVQREYMVAKYDGANGFTYKDW